MRLDKAKTGRREEACPQADFPRERRVAVASINPKLKFNLTQILASIYLPPPPAPPTDLELSK